MLKYKQKVFQFQGLKSCKVTVDFTGGHLRDAYGGMIRDGADLRHTLQCQHPAAQGRYDGKQPTGQVRISCKSESV